MTDKGKRVVIRLNYDKDKKRKQLIDPRMVTVWHKGRITGAIVILALLIGSMVFLISGEETKENKPLSLESVKQVQPIAAAQNDEISVPKAETNSVQSDPINTRSSVMPNPKREASSSGDAKQPPAIIFDRRVIRASLNTAPRYGEPGEPIKPLVSLMPEQTVEAFYFSEIKNMKNRVLFHQWFKNGELVYKKHFNVETDKFKLISSKKLTAKDVGEWQVALIDQKGRRYSEVNFSVNP